ncbi:putative cyclin-dependent serine/threonine-protein kinase isoform X1 [Salvia divinorum]|uniref:Cyclin-dependent serine/threonine-protein kinase isoform X1 n=1 Tax=Salvia divinorum TaxID=28513 RepID=A0ABD1FY65_SALDI
MALLGEDGRGYELARKLESQGVWRPWLGDALYPSFIPFLSSPAAWDSFMLPDDSKSRPQISLELRARALLFDKASVSLFAQPTALSKLNPNYLELHGDDVYFTLENGAQDVDERHPGVAALSTTSSKRRSKASGIGSRFSEPDVDAVSQRLRLEELPETWYNQFFEKYRATKSYTLMFGDRESEKRTPEQMSTYLSLIENHKRRRVAFVDNISSLQSNPVMVDGSPADDAPFFPETMSIFNCVPDSAVLKTRKLENNPKVPFNGVLDNLPQTMTKSPVMSPIMIERLGIRPEYLSMEQGQACGKNGSQGSRKLLSQEQALRISQKVVVRLLHNVGFESSSDTSLEVIAQLLSRHINKLGRTLKLLADSYKKQCSATELLKMFLQTAGYSNLRTLVELMKDNSKSVAPQTQQQGLSIQGQILPQQQPSVQQSQQMLRQMSPQMQQMNNPQYLAFQQQQQQWERMRRRQQQQQQLQQQQQQQQQSTPRPGMNMNMSIDKDRPLVQVKMEAPSDFPLDTNTFTSMNPRQPQLRQQQLAAISSFHAQANNNAFRPMTSLQIPQIHSPTMSMARAPPVKVEGFQELMGGDSSVKHDSEDNKLLSPHK